MQIKLISLDRGFSPDKVVTNPNPLLDKAGTFSDDGVFSERIFGRMPSSGREYSCDCGHMEGRFYEGSLCSKCGQEVIQRDTAFAKRGWVDLGEYRILSPLFFTYISKIVGPSALVKILHQKRVLNVDGIVKNGGHGNNYENLGMLGFIERWEEIVDHFCGKRKSDPRVAEYAELVRTYADKLFTSKIPIFSHILRPALVVDGTLHFDEINNVFNLLIASAQQLGSYSALEKTDSVVNSALWRIQERANEIFNHVIQSLSHKKGYIRSSLLGVRVNFSARCVITPLPPGYEQDEMAIPYLTFLELYKFQLTNLISRMQGITLRRATEIWSAAQSIFDRSVYSAMKEMIRRAGGGLPALLNRNPTIAFGSILLMRIVLAKPNIADLTISLNNGILKCLGGDYDGDVLAALVLPDNDMAKDFQVFNPRLMMVSRDGPGLNKSMSLAKDHVLGLSVLTEV
jgi:DNA-directed RNA polymerase beta' subunit